ncbi:hypothetical protein GNAINCEL_00016 [Serratia phage KKP 3709]|nr:hypothetical protein GNAINCEL_00016 [Serratia phage KKP 3709]
MAHARRYFDLHGEFDCGDDAGRHAVAVSVCVVIPWVKEPGDVIPLSLCQGLEQAACCATYYLFRFCHFVCPPVL